MVKLIFAFIFIISFVFHLNIYSQNNSAAIKNLSKKADVILTGKVIEKESKWNASKSKIYTITTLQVDENLKGNNNGNSVEIIYPGGEVGDIGEIYSHMPRFHDNEEVVVFLQKDKKNSRFKVVNGEEGKLSIINDGKTNTKVTSLGFSIKSLKKQISNFLKQQ